MDYEKMTAEQLEKENKKLMTLIAGIRAKKKQIADILNQRAAEAKVAGMSDSERAALARVLQPKGIGSAEAVGKPGTS